MIEIQVKLLEKSLQTQESHPGTVGRPNPGPRHLEEWAQDWTLAMLLDQGYHYAHILCTILLAILEHFSPFQFKRIICNII